MKTQDQVIESITRFRESFWDRKTTSRPPVGIYDENTSLPINFLRQPFTRPTVCPEDLNGDFVATEYEYSFAKRAVISDDFMAFAAPWRGIPWLEAACGCQVRYSEGSLAPAHFVDSLEELEQIPIPAANGWLDCMRRETERIAASAPPECWVSPSILRGTSDVLAAMRGMTEFFLDLHDNPQAVQKAARRVNLALIKAIDIHYSLVQPKLGGYGHLFGHWAPSKTFMLQEDALGMCSPAVYREIFMPLNAAIIRHLGASVFFHFHSTGHQHYTHVMDLPGIAGLQISMESIGPTLLEMVPVFQQILGKTRLMLQVCTGFEYLPEALRKLPHDGLYVIIPSKYIPTDKAFREFVAANLPGLDSVVTRASRPLSRERSATARSARARCPRPSGRDAHGTSYKKLCLQLLYRTPVPIRSCEPSLRLDRLLIDAICHHSQRVEESRTALAGENLRKLIELTVHLRGPQGCAWDRAQDYDTLKALLLEEAYEVVDAVNARDFDGLEDELGDLLFLVVFYSRMAEEEGRFSVDDVVDQVHAKLIRRHPHVFGEVRAGNAGEALQSWMAVKEKERVAAGKRARNSVLDGILPSLPSTMVAHELGTRAADVGFEWAKAGDLLEKIEEEIHELRRELAAEPPSPAARVEEEVGDLLFAVANLSRFLHFDAETCLRRANQKFERRFQAMEQELLQRGKALKECSLDEMEAVWGEVKAREGESSSS